MTIRSYASPRKPNAAQLATWLNEAHQWHRIADDRRLAPNKLEEARNKVDALIAQILEANPKHGAALRLKYRSQAAVGRVRSALRTLEELSRREPYSSDVWFSLGNAALSCHEPQQAESAFSRVLELEKDRADAYCGIAQAKLQQGDFLGAYLRAASAYRQGYRESAVYLTLEQSAGMMHCDHYDAQTDALLQDMLQDSQLNPECLSNLVGSQLRHKYDLDNPDAAIDIAACAQDGLLLNGLLLTSLQDEACETLFTLLRQHLFLTACASGELEEGVQTLILAISVHAQRNDYLAPISPDESAILDSLNPHIEASLNEGGTPEDLVAALLLVSMYKPLYPERYSFRLLSWDLEEWPSRTQGVFRLNLYNYANEHALRHALCQTEEAKEHELLSSETRTAFPKWSLPELVQEWRELENDPPQLERAQQPRILVLGCETGKRAIALAQYYPRAQVLAIDHNSYDLAYASRQAAELGCENIEFILGDWNQNLPTSEEPFDLIECSAYVDKAPSLAWASQLSQLTATDGLLRLVDSRHNLPYLAVGNAVPLAHTEAFQEWRQALLSRPMDDIDSLTRLALFNREGSRRLLAESSRRRCDLNQELENLGVTGDQKTLDNVTRLHAFDPGQILAS